MGARRSISALSFWLLVAVCVAGFRAIGQQPQIAAVVRPDVQALLDYLRSDYETPERDAQVRHELSARPDIKPDLFRLAMVNPEVVKLKELDEAIATIEKRLSGF